MAAAGGSGDEEILLKDSFVVGKVVHKVIITPKGIQWFREGAGTKTSWVLYKDILAVIQPDEKEKSPKNHPNATSFSVHYIHATEKNENVWQALSVNFVAAEHHIVDKWVQTITARYKPEVSQRPKNLLVFVNPLGGKKKGRQIYLNYVAPLFTLAGVSTHVIVTERGGQIKDTIIAHENLGKFDGIVTVGGDGTFTEAVNGVLVREARNNGIDLNNPEMNLVQFKGRIGLIPAGTGQGNVLMAYGTKDVTSAALNIIRGATFCMDVFSVHDNQELRALGNLLSAYGVLSRAIEVSENNRWLGRPRYLWGMGKSMIQAHDYAFEAELHFKPCTEHHHASTQNNNENTSSQQHPSVVNDTAVSTMPTLHSADDLAAHTKDAKSDHLQKGQGHHASSKSLGAEPKRKQPVDSDMYPGWKMIRSLFMNIDCFMSDMLMIDNQASGCFYMSYAHECSRTVFVKTIHRMMRGSKDTYSFDEVYRCAASEYHIKVLPLSPNSPHKRANAINIDGDAFPFTGNSIHVKDHPNVICVFGRRDDVDLKTVDRYL